MQKWEYVALALMNSYGMQYRLNGDKHGHWKDKPIHEVFEELGAFGWEFISYDGTQYIFKRPLMEGVPKFAGQPEEGEHKPGTGSLRKLGADPHEKPSTGSLHKLK